MTWMNVVSVSWTVVALASTQGVDGQSKSKSKGGQVMAKFPPHPGTIAKIDESDGSVRIEKAEETPERHRFVYLDKTGMEVDSADQAAERIPIVEVRMTPTDGEGRIVSKDHARLFRIREFGPEHRLLRSTTMTGGKPPSHH